MVPCADAAFTATMEQHTIIFNESSERTKQRYDSERVKGGHLYHLNDMDDKGDVSQHCLKEYHRHLYQDNPNGVRQHYKWHTNNCKFFNSFEDFLDQCWVPCTRLQEDRRCQQCEDHLPEGLSSGKVIVMCYLCIRFVVGSKFDEHVSNYHLEFVPEAHRGNTLQRT